MLGTSDAEHIRDDLSEWAAALPGIDPLRVREPCEDLPGQRLVGTWSGLIVLAVHELRIDRLCPGQAHHVAPDRPARRVGCCLAERIL